MPTKLNSKSKINRYTKRDHLDDLDYLSLEERRWIRALRSGNYRQGVCELKQFNELGPGYRYCCLGVLLEILDVKQRISKEDGISIEFQDRDGQDDEYWTSSVLPDKIIDSIGFVTPDVKLDFNVKDEYSNSGRIGLTTCNDRLLLTFSEIADLIENGRLRKT